MKAIARQLRIGAIAIGFELVMLVVGFWNIGPCGPGTPIGMIALLTQIPFIVVSKQFFPSDTQDTEWGEWPLVLAAVLATIVWMAAIFIVTSGSRALVAKLRPIRKFD